MLKCQFFIAIITVFLFSIIFQGTEAHEDMLRMQGFSKVDCFTKQMHPVPLNVQVFLTLARIHLWNLFGALTRLMRMQKSLQ